MSNPFGQSSTALNDELRDFIKYVDSFYGMNDPLYPLSNKDNGLPLTEKDILIATHQYLATITKRNSETYTWGEGDSLDRERVRDILLNDWDFYLVHLQHGNV